MHFVDIPCVEIKAYNVRSILRDRLEAEKRKKKEEKKNKKSKINISYVLSVQSGTTRITKSGLEGNKQMSIRKRLRFAFPLFLKSLAVVVVPCLFHPLLPPTMATADTSTANDSKNPSPSKSSSLFKRRSSKKGKADANGHQQHPVVKEGAGIASNTPANEGSASNQTGMFHICLFGFYIEK